MSGAVAEALLPLLMLAVFVPLLPGLETRQPAEVGDIILSGTASDCRTQESARLDGQCPAQSPKPYCPC